MLPVPDLSNEEWTILETLFSRAENAAARPGRWLVRQGAKDTSRGGRPRASDRAVINAIWYVLWTGCQWKAVHRDWFGVSASVIHERFQR
jgi:transposase